MTPLRQRMLEDMQLRNLAPQTQRSYINHVKGLAEFYQVSPELLDDLDPVPFGEDRLHCRTAPLLVAPVQMLHLAFLDAAGVRQHDGAVIFGKA